MNNWIDAEKNPTEEGNYLVWMPRLEEEAVIRMWQGDDFGWYNGRTGEYESVDVTHWQPLPEPPKQ